jgi:hypothetical protein
MQLVRRSLVAVAVLTALVAAAAPAFAHEEISPKTFPTGTPTFFFLTAANESTANVTKVVVTAPSGVPIGTSTREPAGWTSSRTAAAVTFTAGAGAGVKPDHFEQFGFETDGAGQPGTFVFKVVLTTADGKTTNVDVPVTATTGTASSGSTATTGTTIAASTTTTGATATTATTPVTVPASNTVKSRANSALAVGVIALVVALLALILALTRRRAAGPDPTALPPSSEGGNW